jgi:chaperone modulatory protein CbpM
MPITTSQPLSGHIVEEYGYVSIEDLSRLCAVDSRHIVELVEEGILELRDAEPPAAAWHFSSEHVRRAKLALRLERDLEINLAGVALALQLMEELERMRGEIHGRLSR